MRGSYDGAKFAGALALAMSVCVVDDTLRVQEHGSNLTTAVI